MKLLTVAIPCYNSEEYMEKSIRSALNGGDPRVEVIVVDDGSTDATYEIGKKYERKFPNIVKVVHQENAGHGGAVNAGIKNATGLYFKVLDSDDRLGKKALARTVDFIEEAVSKDMDIDMIITNFIYDKQGSKYKKLMSFKSAMPAGRVFTWDDVHFGRTQYMLMHGVMYRTKVLRESGLELPKHTFYVDNIYVFQPLPYVKKIYYLDIVLYKYFIGRDDQSVNEKVMLKRLDQQYRVTRFMFEEYEKMTITNKNLDKVLVHYFDMMMCVSTVFSYREGSEERFRDQQELWELVKEKDPKLYKKVRYSVLGRGVHMPGGKPGRKMVEFGYRIVRKFFGFN